MFVFFRSQPAFKAKFCFPKTCIICQNTKFATNQCKGQNTLKYNQIHLNTLIYTQIINYTEIYSKPLTKPAAQAAGADPFHSPKLL